MRTSMASISSKKKSSRHSEVSGQFGEILVAYLLSKNGFEVARVDHTGLDILAFHRQSRKRLGISVKNRTWDAKGARQNSSVSFPCADLGRLEEACRAFSADPFVAAVVDRPENVSMWMIPLSRARQLNTVTEKYLYFSVTKKAEAQYRGLPDGFSASLKWASSEMS